MFSDFVVGGEVVVESVYSGNLPINAMSLGIVNKNNVVSATAEGEGNPVFIVGSKTEEMVFMVQHLHQKSYLKRPSLNVLVFK